MTKDATYGEGCCLFWWFPVFLGWTSTKHKVSILLKQNQHHSDSSALFPLSLCHKIATLRPQPNALTTVPLSSALGRLNQNGFSWYSYDPYYEHGYFEDMQYQLYTVLWKENQTLLSMCVDERRNSN